jgi:hypothetical protein
MQLNDERHCISIQFVLEHDIFYWFGMLLFDDSP